MKTETPKLKPVTIQLSEDNHRKLKLCAAMKDETMSALVESYIEACLKADIQAVVAELAA